MTKCPLLIAKHNAAPPKHEQHIGMMIMPTIDERVRHRHEVGIVPVELWSQEDPCMCAVAPWKLNNLDAPMQVERDKMTGCSCRFVADEGIDLVRAWPTIVQIILRHADPVEGDVTQHHGQVNYDLPPANAVLPAGKTRADRPRQNWGSWLFSSAHGYLSAR